MTAVTCVNVADAASDFERFGKKTEGKHNESFDPAFAKRGGNRLRPLPDDATVFKMRQS